jgi:hypothetical protein
MKPIMTLLTCLVVIALAAAPAFSARPHFMEGPTCCQEGSTVTCSGDIAGIGEEQLDINVTASGLTTCTNRGAGGTEPAGLDTTASGTDTGIQPENGRAEFSVEATAANPCPDRMTANTTFTSATVTVFQGGEQVLQRRNIAVSACP